MVDFWTYDLADLKITETEKYKSEIHLYRSEQSKRLSDLFGKSNGAILVDTGLRLLGYGEKKLDEAWPAFLEKVSSGKYDRIGYDELIEPDGYYLDEWNYRDPTKEAILEVMDLEKSYKENFLAKELSGLDWPEFREMALLLKKDVCYTFIHPIISVGFRKFDSVKPSKGQAKRDKINGQAGSAAEVSEDKISELYSEIAAEHALSWYRINRPELFER